MNTHDLTYWLFGNLRWSDFPPKSDLIATGAASLVILGALGVVVLLTVTRRWRWLWSEWLTSLDHKKIGIMYIVIAFVMLARAVVEAALMRTQQAVAINAPGVVSPEHFAQLFTTHGSVMIFFMAMPFLSGIINYVMPLQIGARDLTFPFMNAVGLWLTGAGAALVMVSLVIGKFSIGGWSGYPPFTELPFSPGEGVDYWIWAVTLSSLGTTLTGINFAVTLYKERAPGMRLFRLPLFAWTSLCTAILMIFAMPPLTVATALLALDRYAGFHFFTNDLGGNMMNYANLFWLFGHPEVYILILPAFGIWSEVISTFSGKRLYGYKSMVFAVMCIAVLSFTVWLHHFFTMGQSANVNAVFGIATMLIGIPTGVKVYDWLLTMYGGRLRLTAPMLFAVTFLFCFVLGGLSGIILANPPVDFSVHNSLFLVAHFHNMLIPGTLFGMIAGYMFWFPKAFGFRLEETWGRIAWGCWSAGFLLAFLPLYMLGLFGMMRRTAETFRAEYAPWLWTAWGGAGLIVCGLGALIVQLIVSIRRREALAVPVGDPWDGHSLEWWTSSPPPEYNFAVLPKIEETEAFTAMKRRGRAYESPEDYADITMPKHTGLPVMIGAAGFVCAFALTWHIWWAAALGLLAMWGGVVARSFRSDFEHVIPAAQIERENEAWLARARATTPVDRFAELDPANRGKAVERQ
ncbi:cbb3-type cytochrome c oxidase subunit I [Stakelama tenebrarum]|uniref:Cytochrome ubiquinol oxidase subunit I n=1 Tax=Stakelama tenebrarum TaxID=2711215 RepID=A0A6G6Y6L9_9SPHN|nr:cbb3-type cytochrome c oxidase subunit I [Sphingosinithalassobacter tenebrarum]QIG80226.1 cytochrome ubiquinol oxidase subunit I [Sphingosinithalassobacter tenebrarum]